MNVSLVSSRYADALLKYAMETGQDKIVYNEMKAIYNILLNNKDLQKALFNPFVDDKQKRVLLITALGGTLSDAGSRFINLLLKNNRMEKLKYICLKYRDLYLQQNNIYRGHLTTVVEWSENEKEKLKDIVLQGHKGDIEFEYKVDKNILGGFIFEINNVRLDASVKTQIRQIRNELLDQNKRIV
ncbi:MAG: F0F1 ATP synthase subunit delta [Bacteroidales bacterium]|jgi:F-type H+-transporting ATPase subunit delta